MAFRDTNRDPGFKVPPHRDNVFFNTDSFVGPPSAAAIRSNFIKPNQEDDVFLVQFFFKKIAENPKAFSSPFRPPKKFLVMKVDGKYGPITQAWIDEFQNHLFRIGRPVLRDGVADRVKNGQAVGPRGFLFTLAMLNVAMGQVVGDAGWDTWWKAADVPGLLRSKIRDPATFF
jgi:hypothetical protein